MLSAAFFLTCGHARSLLRRIPVIPPECARMLFGPEEVSAEPFSYRRNASGCSRDHLCSPDKATVKTAIGLLHYNDMFLPPQLKKARAARGPFIPDSIRIITIYCESATMRKDLSPADLSPDGPCPRQRCRRSPRGYGSRRAPARARWYDSGS